MHSDLRAQVAFRLTGLRADGHSPPDARQLRPALAARLRDLASLRYDFPVLLAANPKDAAFAAPLRVVVDKLAEGKDPAAREELLKLERQARIAIADGNSAEADGARKALKLEGTLVDCDGAFPRRYVLHAWEVLQKRKAARFQADVQRLLLGLNDILCAEDARSPAGRSATRLRENFGDAHREAFDFEAMSRLLQRAPERRGLTEARRRRIRSLMAALESQRFFGAASGFGFEFDRCGTALKAFHARYASARSLARSLAMARLEVSGEYDETLHGPLFRQMRENALTREELALFPDYFVCVRDGELDAAERAEIVELLGSGIPAKVLVQTDDILGDTAGSDGLAAIAARSQALAGAGAGLGDVFVVQAASSDLPRMAAEVFDALAYPGPALLSVYSGVSQTSMPPYLNAAVAVEARAFPSFTYDPRKPLDQGSRYSIEHNPQPGCDWPLHAFDYEDAQHQRAHRDVAFTSADLLATDPRFAKHFQWLHGAARPVCVADVIDAEVPEDATPVVSMVDDADTLRDLAVEETVMLLAQRTRASWRNLQALARGPIVREVVKEVVIPAAAGDVTPAKPGVQQATAEAAPAPAAVVAPAPAPAPSSDEPYIETPRCTTCNECTTINNKMFAYDGNKQAYIADLGAGTYRQLVEAAESCQVSIIHPGKPKNPNEEGLAELLERAAPFQ